MEQRATKSGLVLEGGALRGLYSAGIMDVLMEHGVRFDGVIGVSAGAAFGCNYVSHQVGRAIRYNKRFARDKRYCSLHSLITSGDIYNAEFCYHTMPNELDRFDVEAFNASDTEFWVVCIDVLTGEPVYHRCSEAGDVMYEWIRASSSLPLVARVVDVDGRRLLDGGLIDSMPLAEFQKMGYDRNVVILTRPQEYRKHHSRWMPVLKWLMRRYPAVAHAMETRCEVYNRQLEYIAKEEQAGRALVFRPTPGLTIGHVCHDADLMQATYEQGRHHAEQRLDEVLSYLA